MRCDGTFSHDIIKFCGDDERWTVYQYHSSMTLKQLKHYWWQRYDTIRYWCLCINARLYAHYTPSHHTTHSAHAIKNTHKLCMNCYSIWDDDDDNGNDIINIKLDDDFLTFHHEVVFCMAFVTTMLAVFLFFPHFPSVQQQLENIRAVSG